MVDGFNIVCNLLCIGMNGVLSSSSSSIYLYIRDVVLRVGSFYGVVIRTVYFCYLLNENSID